MFSSTSPFSYAVTLLFLITLSPFVSSHIEMSQPFGLRSPLNPAKSDDKVDYNLKSPLSADGSNFPCHGYQNDPFVATATYTAGKTYQMAVSGSATHGGGSCQLSLSYDNGGTFKVIKSMVGGCPLTQQYDFTIPSFAPTGNALFAWTWFNEIGNREMYMNCAFVQIAGSSAARRSQQKRQSTFTSMSSLPSIWRANLGGLNQCATAEGVDPVFPNLGPDVIYGGASSSSSPRDTQNGCDSPTPFGQTYQGSRVAGASAESSTAQNSATTTPSSSISSATTPVSSANTTSTPTVAKTGDENAETTSAQNSAAATTSASISSATTPVSSANTTSTPTIAKTGDENAETTSAQNSAAATTSASISSANAMSAPTVATTGVENAETTAPISTPTAPASADSSTAAAAPAAPTSAASAALAKVVKSTPKSNPSSASPTTRAAASDSASSPFRAKSLNPEISDKSKNDRGAMPRGHYQSGRYA